MAITYTSKHHSPQDPGGVIREVLDMGADFPGPAKDVLLAWVLRLEDGLDPAAAARDLIETYDLAEDAPAAGACAELITLLRETAAYGVERMAARTCRPRSQRRRGRRARRG
jgi:hypothetical protein